MESRLKGSITLIFLLLGLILSSPCYAQPNEPEANGRLVAMNFKDADLDYVLNFFSRATGYTIIKDAEIKGRVTIISDKDIPVDQAISALTSILTMKGYSGVINSDGKVLKVVPLDSAKREDSEIKVGTDPDKIDAGDTIVTQIMPLASANAAQIVKELKDLVPGYGVMVAHTQSNSLILTATSSNIKRFAQIVKELDVPMSDMITVEVFVIKYRDATTLETVLTDLFKSDTNAAQQAQQELNARLQRFRGGPPGGPGMDMQSESTTTGSTESELLQIRSNVKVVADEDTNTLIVSATKENIALIRTIIEKLDTQVVDQAVTRIFTLQHADATEVADEITGLFQSTTSTTRRTSSRSQTTFGQTFGRGGFPGGQFFQQPGGTQSGQQGSILGLPEINVVADSRTNSVVVTTTSQQVESVGNLIKQLDTDVSEYEETTVVFPLENADASDMTQVLNSLFQTTAFERRRGTTTSISSRGGVMGTAAETIESARGLTGNVKIVAVETTNSLIITTYKRNLETLEKIIKELDVILPQVLIEVKIIEVTLDDNTKFGIEWMWEHATNIKGESYDQNGKTSFGLTDELYGLKYAILGQTIEGLLMALEKNTKVNILSTPKILTLDNHEAVINISQEVPYLESTQETGSGSVITSYNYKDVGVILTVTPRINKSETVSLDVNQQINNLVEFTLFNAPVISKREATASVTVKDGQTMIIGGIIEDNKTETINRVPILSSIPFIGKLFQRKETTAGKTELMVFITPRIIRNPEEASKLHSDMSDELERKFNSK